MTKQMFHSGVSEAIEDRCGPWRIKWLPAEFLIPNIGSFTFKKIVLPIEIFGFGDASHDSGYVVLKLEDGFQFAILQGSRLMELKVFKRLVSAEVLAATERTSCCFDCAGEGGTIPRLWSGSVCEGCRRPYCKNPFCLRRLDADDSREGLEECWSCRASAELVDRR